jgi:hypothetical protein
MVIVFQQNIKKTTDNIGARSENDTTALNMTAFWDTVLCNPMKEIVSTSDTHINFYETTLHNILKGCHLHTHCCENLKTQSSLLHK